MVVDIDGGLTPYTASAKIGSAAVAPGRLFDVNFGTETSLTIVVTAKGSQPGATNATLTITAALKAPAAAAPPGSTQPPDVPAVTVQTTSVMQGTAAQTAPVLELVSQTSSQATIAVDVSDPAVAETTQWIVAGNPAGSGPTATVDCPPGANVAGQAVLPAAAVAPPPFPAYYRFDHPNVRTEPNPAAYATIPGNVKDVVAPDEGLTTPWPASDAATVLAGQLQNVPDNTAIDIKGYVSFESHDNPSASPPSSDWTYNNSLAQNRAVGLQAIIQAIPGRSFTFPSVAADMTNWGPAQGGWVGARAQWWKAVATWTAPPPPGTTITGTVSRPAAQPPVPVPVPDNPTSASPPDPPSWSSSWMSKFASCATTWWPARWPASSTSRRRRKRNSPPAAYRGSKFQPGAMSAARTLPTASSMPAWWCRSTMPPTSSRRACISARTPPISTD